MQSDIPGLQITIVCTEIVKREPHDIFTLQELRQAPDAQGHVHERMREAARFTDEEQLGVNLIRRTLEEPVRQIANNAGFEGAVVINHVRDEAGSFGFNAETGIYEDLMQAGIVDPTKVSRLALQHAASSAGLFLTMEAMIADKPHGVGKASAPSMPSMDSY